MYEESKIVKLIKAENRLVVATNGRREKQEVAVKYQVSVIQDK